MNDILREHLEIANKTAGTPTGLELLKLEQTPENYYAANAYLVALAYIRDLEARLTQRAVDVATLCAHRFHAEDDVDIICIDCGARTPRN